MTIHFPMRLPLLLLLILLLGISACGGEDETSAEELPLSTNLLTLASPVFTQGEPIPSPYTCDGADVPPPLTWQDVPTDVGSYALIMDDPDAPRGTWIHWVLYNIPADAQELPDGEPSGTGVQGENSWGDLGYGGPCPPGDEHRYFFKLYALDTELDLEAGADKEALLAAMEGHVLAQGQLMGVYERE